MRSHLVQYLKYFNYCFKGGEIIRREYSHMDKLRCDLLRVCCGLWSLLVNNKNEIKITASKYGNKSRIVFYFSLENFFASEVSRQKKKLVCELAYKMCFSDPLIVSACRNMSVELNQRYYISPKTIDQL